MQFLHRNKLELRIYESVEVDVIRSIVSLTSLVDIHRASCCLQRSCDSIKGFHVVSTLQDCSCKPQCPDILYHCIDLDDSVDFKYMRGGSARKFMRQRNTKMGWNRRIRMIDEIFRSFVYR